jgi:CheY-like chemotaxis protein
MPVMNGTEAARKLREAGYAGVIIGMTGDPRGCDDRDRFEDAGLDMCVDKTVQGMALLASTVKELARSYGARLETAGTAS